MERKPGGDAGQLWRGLEQLMQDPSVAEALEREFPSLAAKGLTRREFVLLCAATLAAGACSAPAEHIVPLAEDPEQRVQGVSLHYASAEPFRGFARGVLVRSFEGRPVKIEGNPLHPASLGATGPHAQAALLTLFDRSRAEPPRRRGRSSSWGAFAREAPRAAGRGLRILTPPTTSPLLIAQIRQLLDRYPGSRWHQWDPLMTSEASRRGSVLAHGADLVPHLHVDRADVIVALDSDFLIRDPASLVHARRFAERRTPSPAMNRLWCAEPMPTGTGAAADHRLPARASRIPALTSALASRLGLPAAAPPLTPAEQKWIAGAATDLLDHRGRVLVVAGDEQPPQVHALTYAINHALDSSGETITFREPVSTAPIDTIADLRELTSAMHAGGVHALLIAGCNPVYDAPADLGFSHALERVGWSAHLSLYDDETSGATTWHLPQTHWLEQWSDIRAFDGTLTLAQPLIQPLYGGRSIHECLSMFDSPAHGYEILRTFWSARGIDWEQALRDGTVPGWQTDAVAVPANAATLPPITLEPTEGLELALRPDAFVLDGEQANNGWLQELPRPITKLVWSNAAMISPATSERFGMENDTSIEIAANGRSLEAAVWVVPGHADDTVTLHLGYGRWRAGGLGADVGFDASPVRTTGSPWTVRGVSISAGTARHKHLVTTQYHGLLEGRDLVRVAALQSVLGAGLESTHEEPDESMYPEFRYDGHAWGMSIDLSACLDCGACVAACNAENNVPFVGREEVAQGREMHWLRIDRYFEGSAANPRIHHQPLLCMHCEKAPCEPVCPVSATVHSTEGLNEMVYNRCVGTRYCSNNCPYKVRRFNFHEYSGRAPEVRLRANPDVTIRSRGVMEKCTYCVQRIQAARITAGKQQRAIRDGDVVTACQAACPTRAIVFGDINDPASLVSQRKRDRRNYALLGGLNTRPRTTYLTRIINSRDGDDGE